MTPQFTSLCHSSSLDKVMFLAIGIFLVIDLDNPFLTVVIAHMACPTYIAYFSIGKKCNNVCRFFSCWIFATERDPFCFRIPIESMADVLAIHEKVHLVFFADELFDCTHLPIRSFLIFPIRAHKKAIPSSRQDCGVLVLSHRSSFSTLPFGRLLCGHKACPSRTLYRLILL